MDPTAYLIRTLEKEKRALQVQNNILQEKNDVLQEEKDALSIQLVDTHRKNINTRRKNVELKYKLYQAKVEVQSMRRLMLAQPPPLIESDWDSEHHDTEISDTEVEAAQDSLREILAELDASDTKSQESYEENDFTSDLDNENDTVLAEGSEEMDLVSRTGQPINMDSEGEESEIGTNINKLSEEKVTDSDDEEDTMMGDFNFVQELFHPKNEPDTENESDAESNSNMSIDLVRHIMEQSTAGKHEILSRSGPIWEAQKGAMKNAIEGFAFYKRMVTFHVVWENGGNDWKTKLRGAGYKVDQKPQRGNQGHPGKGMTADARVKQIRDSCRKERNFSIQVYKLLVPYVNFSINHDKLLKAINDYYIQDGADIASGENLANEWTQYMRTKAFSMKAEGVAGGLEQQTFYRL